MPQPLIFNFKHPSVWEDRKDYIRWGATACMSGVRYVFRQCVIMIKDLYDINDPDFISDEGKKILKDMKEGRIKGTFYVNQIPEIADPTKLETKIHQYK